MNPKIDLYLEDGCGRCKYYKTPQCKVHTWKEALITLRELVLSTGLTEELKWSMPTYTSEGNNILMICAFKDFCALSFFKGSLIEDAQGLLSKHGESSQSARTLKFTSSSQVHALKDQILDYIYEAIEIEKSGIKVVFKKDLEPMPVELIQRFSEDASLRESFYALTLGRQRGYIIHFSQPKQSKTILSRIDNFRDKILAGKGFQDR